MSMQPDVDRMVAFLRARLDEDEQVAAIRSDYRSWRRPPESGDEVVDALGSVIATTRHPDHIARHDPVRVLAEGDAKRRIVQMAADYSPELEHGDNGEWALDATLRLLALPFASHPDYDPSWRPA